MKRTLAAALSILLAAVAVTARADVLAEVGNGDKITGTLNPATEREVFQVRVPKGASITIKGKSGTKGLTLSVALTDPADAPIDAATGTAPSLKGIVAGASGLYSVAVTAGAGSPPGNYSLSISWKSPTSFSASADLAAAGSSNLEFAVDAGATVTISAKKGKGSGAAPVLNLLTPPAGAALPLVGATVKRALAGSGSYVLAFGNLGPAQGVVAASVKVKPAKVTKRKITLTSNVIGSGGAAGDAAFASVLGAAGGTVTVPVLPPGSPGAQISGSAVTIPPGALGAGTSIIVATAPNITTPGGSDDAGPTVFFGPEGTSFDSIDKNARATITIPYDPNFESVRDSLIVYTRDAKGKVTPVPPPYSFNSLTHTMSFQTSHFSSFQATGVGTPPSSELFTYANVTTPQSLCLAFDGTAAENPYLFYVAEGPNRTVAGLRLADIPGVLLQRDVWAGGGASVVANGTVPRQQFKFVDPVQCVFAQDDGVVIVATTRQVFRVDTDDNVYLVAGTGSTGDGGDGSVATAATFTQISSIRVTFDGTVWIADKGAHRIRIVDASQGNVINPFAGSGQAGFGTDNSPVAQTTFLGPNDIEFSGDGGLYVADGGRVRLLKPSPVNPSQDINVTIAGDATGSTGSIGDDGSLLAAQFESISSISTYFDPFNPVPALPFLVVSDSGDHTVRYLDQTNDTVTLLAGQHGVAGNAPDFSTKTGLLDTPLGILTLPSEVIIADSGNGKIRVRFGFTGQ